MSSPSHSMQKELPRVNDLAKFFSYQDYPAYFLHINGIDEKHNLPTNITVLHTVYFRIRQLFYTKFYPAFVKYYGM